MSDNICPHCETDLQGKPIPQEYIDKGYYGPPETAPTHYSNVVSVEIRGVYDGGLFWQCPACGGRWHRHEPTSRLGLKAQPYIDGLL